MRFRRKACNARNGVSVVGGWMDGRVHGWLRERGQIAEVRDQMFPYAYQSGSRLLPRVCVGASMCACMDVFQRLHVGLFACTCSDRQSRDQQAQQLVASAPVAAVGDKSTAGKTGPRVLEENALRNHTQRLCCTTFCPM